MIKRSVSLLIVGFLFNSCVNWKVPILNKRSGLINSNFSKNQDFDFSSGIMVIPVYIKGKKHEFIFDTGASTTIISKEAAESLNLKNKGGSTNIRDSNGNRKKMQNSRVDTMTIAGVNFTNVNVSIIDWPENSVVECIAKDGIIGNNLISHCNWFVDYQKKQLTLTDGGLDEKGVTFIKMLSPRNRPHFNLSLNGYNIPWVLLDLGSGGGLDIGRDLANQFNLNISDFPKYYEIDGSSHGLFGSNMDTVTNFLADSMLIGPLLLKHVPVELQRKKSSKIGNRILKNYSLILDYQNEKIGFLPYKKDAPDLGDGKSFGFSVSRNNKEFFVSNILQGSKADSLGLKYGDALLKVNNRSFENFESHCEFMTYLFSDIRTKDTLTVVTKSQPEQQMVFEKTRLWKN